MTPRLNLNSPHPVGVLLMAPLARMADLPLLPAVIVGGVYSQIARRIVDDPFSGLLPLIVAVSIYDWWYGRRAARLTKGPDGKSAFRPELAMIGLHQKIGAIGIVCFIRALELWTAPNVFQTNGMAAIIIGLGLILEELSSIEEKRISIGAKPLFLLSPILAVARGVLRRQVPPAPPAG